MEQPLLLTVDVGNTNVSLAVFDGPRRLAFWRLSTDRRRTADEYRPLLTQLLGLIGLQPDGLDGVVVASVVPPVLSALVDAFRQMGVPAQVLTGERDFGIPVRYDPPTTVGADRLANAIAVQALYGQPAIIADLGTATTIDVLDRSGAYVGGAIAPGFEASMEGLFSTAFQLPRLDLGPPPAAIGRNTVDSIRSGGLFGWAGLVDGLIARFRAELEGGPHVVATGGLAPLVAPYCREVQVVNEELTLEGLRLAHERLAPDR